MPYSEAVRSVPNYKCEECGTPFFSDRKTTRDRRGRFCSVTCSNRWVARTRPTTKGWLKTPRGYIAEWNPKHPMAHKTGYVLQHRRVMAEVLGRNLTADEVVDHLNGIKDDNRPENLRVLNKRDHDRLPKPPKKPIKCPHCHWTILISGRVSYVEGVLPPENVQE